MSDSFEKHEKKIERAAKFAAIGFIGLWIAQLLLIVGAIYVAIHFIVKFW